MPIYVYECPECDIELEELRPAWQADIPVECPICHGWCTRVISTFHTRRQAEPVYATPAQIARVVHGLDCSCCRPRRRS
ncbi:FmdB family zinc ribbon protein [Chloroflexus aggregans]|jgi:putative FmdB family regulatory protein|uniref:Regulatory protein, FmdB family n=1 Tax=Chloroflexus aggregans (strain MD-66 / DSM 9485) TaxID=326427 RepID=B8G2W4_CHLAD|nr:zinc ribbon domain-containing protein [Chloroflexus aggregans]ACL23268.1 regulatory protein, FmdB family [Chloroflexus aggregans DSM 9485]